MKLGFHDLHSEDLNILQLSEVWMLNNCFECKGVSDVVSVWVIPKQLLLD